MQRKKDRRATPEGKWTTAKGRYNFKQRHPEKVAAQTAVSNALRLGKLVRQPCEVCRDPDSQAHHDDYSKPLDVRWLCRTHHHAHHVEVRARAHLMTGS
jgi:hypothetical protein